MKLNPFFACVSQQRWRRRQALAACAGRPRSGAVSCAPLPFHCTAARRTNGTAGWRRTAAPAHLFVGRRLCRAPTRRAFVDGRRCCAAHARCRWPSPPPPAQNAVDIDPEIASAEEASAYRSSGSCRAPRGPRRACRARARAASPWPASASHTLLPCPPLRALPALPTCSLPRRARALLWRQLARRFCRRCAGLRDGERALQLRRLAAARRRCGERGAAAAEPQPDAGRAAAGERAARGG